MDARGEYYRLFRLQASGYHTASGAPGGAHRADGPRAPAAFRASNGRGGAPTRMTVRE
jgi:hypothetical protein